MSQYDPTDLRGQERTEAEKSAKERLARETEDGDWKWLASSKRGRRMVWMLLETCGVFRLSFNTNAMQMAFNEGNRNFGNKILATLNRVSPETFSLMMREAREKTENTNGRTSDDGNGDKSN